MEPNKSSVDDDNYDNNYDNKSLPNVPMMSSPLKQSQKSDSNADKNTNPTVSFMIHEDSPDTSRELEPEEVVDVIEPIPAFLDSLSPNRRYRPRSTSSLPYKSAKDKRMQKIRERSISKNLLSRTLSTESLINDVEDDDLDDNTIVPSSTSIVTKVKNSNHPSSFTYDNHTCLSTTSQACRRYYQAQSQIYEGLDYDTCENMLHLEDENNALRHGLASKYLEFKRWIVIFVIGVLTALTGVIIGQTVEILTTYKYQKLMGLINSIDDKSKFLIPLLIWTFVNAFFTFLGSWIVTYMAPVAAGSGIPLIKCYLNGVKVPEVVRVKTYFAKMTGVILSVVGGLACGKEGPMIHCGSSIAAGVSQGKSTTFKFDWNLGLSRFREDHEKRDFVSAGAAAGVAAAFGSPIGGVLFALEEGASFWNQLLVLRIFFCSLISSFTLNAILSYICGEKMGSAGLLNFGKFNDIEFSFYEIPLYAFMGAFGGLTGAFFNYSNKKLTIFRQNFIRKNWLKVIEAIFVAIFTTLFGVFLMSVWAECMPGTTDESDTSPSPSSSSSSSSPSSSSSSSSSSSTLTTTTTNEMNFPVTFMCPKGQHNTMASLWFNTPEQTLKNLFHKKEGTWNIRTLSIFVIAYFFISFVTYGLSVSSGLFIPGLMLGASWGRIIGLILEYLFPNESWIQCGKFALIGASASLGGIVRMTISLTVILIETTGNLSFAVPIMITVFTAKWVGDFFNEGIYDIHIELSNVPFLGWQPPPDSSRIFASEVMHSPVITFQIRETVRNVVEILSQYKHNGFPVVDENTIHRQVRTFGRYRGLILRSQLLVMLKARIFQEYSLDQPWKNLNSIFRNSYPRYPKLDQIMKQLTNDEMNMTIDLRPVMNPSAYTISHAASLNRIFRLFRALGLRHIVVLNDYNEVIGIVTRKDLVFYCTVRFSKHHHGPKPQQPQQQQQELPQSQSNHLPSSSSSISLSINRNDQMV